MTDYATERRAYISQIRSSFEEEAGRGRQPERERSGGKQENTDLSRQQEAVGRWMRVRFVAAITLFLLFFCWYGSGKEFYDMTPAKMIDMIEDHRYDTILQEYDGLLKERILE